ncbi:MAG TPA: hypothetical protein VN635_09390 [Conexibacter sp.]|nr:hypothetical protein [Conexibacter sp.]
MRERLSQLLARPISDRERGRAFAAAAVVLLLAAVALMLVAPPRDERAAAPSSPASTSSAPLTMPPPPTAAAPIRPPSVVIAASRRFLQDYLPYLYGHARGRTFRAASSALGRSLASRPPRVSPAMRRRHPHVVTLSGHQLASRSRWVLTATIADGGGARYPVELVVEQRPTGRAVVVQLGED